MRRKNKVCGKWRDRQTQGTILQICDDLPSSYCRKETRTIVRQTIAAPCDVLIGSDQHQIALIQVSALRHLYVDYL